MGGRTGKGREKAREREEKNVRERRGREEEEKKEKIEGRRDRGVWHFFIECWTLLGWALESLGGVVCFQSISFSPGSQTEDR